MNMYFQLYSSKYSLMTSLSQTGQDNRSDIFYRTLVEHSAWGIILVNCDLKIVFSSPPTDRMTGWSGRDILKRPFSELIHPQDGEIFKQALASVYAKPRQPATNRWRIRHRAGRYITVECTLTNLLADPEVQGILLSFVDVTRQIKQTTEQEPDGTNTWQDASFRMIFDSLPATIA